MTATLLFPANAKEIKREDRFYSHTLWGFKLGPSVSTIVGEIPPNYKMDRIDNIDKFRERAKLFGGLTLEWRMFRRLSFSLEALYSQQGIRGEFYDNDDIALSNNW
jgi:hypothetical protein